MNSYQRTSTHPKTVIVSPPQISILYPVPDSKFTYDSQAVGHLDIGARAQVSPARFTDSLEWSITPITGSHLTLTPANGRGDSILFAFDSLPSDNDQFGRKYIKASLPQYGVAESVLVKVFYPKTATNHPGGGIGTDPNWYYYWGQTPADTGVNIYGGQYCDTLTGGYFARSGYTSADNFFVVCSTACEINNNQQDTAHFGDNGIDLFAEICLHENTHHSKWWYWWGSPPIPPMYDSLYHDRDRDLIPSDLEPGYGLDSTTAYTDTINWISDWEVIARRAMDIWNLGQADFIDWSKPGHQY